MLRLALALSCSSFLLAGCGSNAMPAAEVSREETISQLEAALQAGDPKMIDDLVDFDTLRADLKGEFFKAALEDNNIKDKLEDPANVEKLKTMINDMVDENVTAEAAAELAKEQIGKTPPKNFPPLAEGWTIRPVDPTTFVAEHPDPSGVVGFQFELKGDRYEMTRFDFGGKGFAEKFEDFGIPGY
ncbi:DUF2939 domain-containing protein [Croceicoccus sp. 1NDH52]|nr:DUF2939 domain-containing protein [Croceicoccus gelatinilyticus]